MADSDQDDVVDDVPPRTPPSPPRGRARTRSRSLSPTPTRTEALEQLRREREQLFRRREALAEDFSQRIRAELDFSENASDPVPLLPHREIAVAQVATQARRARYVQLRDRLLQVLYLLSGGGGTHWIWRQIVRLVHQSEAEDRSAGLAPREP